jgi:DNA-binding FrmR family transcriptional regulator
MVLLGGFVDNTLKLIEFVSDILEICWVVARFIFFRGGGVWLGLVGLSDRRSFEGLVGRQLAEEELTSMEDVTELFGRVRLSGLGELDKIRFEGILRAMLTESEMHLDTFTHIVRVAEGEAGKGSRLTAEQRDGMLSILRRIIEVHERCLPVLQQLAIQASEEAVRKQVEKIIDDENRHLAEAREFESYLRKMV